MSPFWVTGRNRPTEPPPAPLVNWWLPPGLVAGSVTTRPVMEWMTPTGTFPEPGAVRARPPVRAFPQEVRPVLDPHELYQLTDDLPDLGQPVLIQALTGFVDAGNASRLAREQLLDLAGRPHDRHLRRRPALRLPVPPPGDDLRRGPLGGLRRPRAGPAPAARRRRDPVPPAHRPGAGPAVGAVRDGGQRAGRPARRPAHRRAQLDPDGRPAHPARPGSPRTPPAGS